MLERLFHLNENRTTIRTELLAGVTTFLAMAWPCSTPAAEERRIAGIRRPARTCLPS